MATSIQPNNSRPIKTGPVPTTTQNDSERTASTTHNYNAETPPQPNINLSTSTPLASATFHVNHLQKIEDGSQSNFDRAGVTGEYAKRLIDRCKQLSSEKTQPQSSARATLYNYFGPSKGQPSLITQELTATGHLQPDITSISPNKLDRLANYLVLYP